MFFTKIARALAWIGFLLGLAILGLAIFGGTQPDYIVFAERYLGTPNTGEAVERAIRIILISIALGVLAEIGTALSRLTVVEDDDY